MTIHDCIKRVELMAMCVFVHVLLYSSFNVCLYVYMHVYASFVNGLVGEGGIGRNGCGPGKKPKDRKGRFFFLLWVIHSLLWILCVYCGCGINLQGLSLGLPLSRH